MSREFIHKLLLETINGMKASKEFRKSQERDQYIQLFNLDKAAIIKVSKNTLNIPEDVATNIYNVLHTKFTEIENNNLKKPSIKADPELSFKLSKAIELKNLPEYQGQFILYNFRQGQEALYKTWGEEAYKYLKSTGSRKSQPDIQKSLSNQKKGSGGAAIEHGGGLGAPLAGVQAFSGIQKFGEQLGTLGVSQDKYERMLMDIYQLSPAKLKLNVIYNTKMQESVSITDKKILGEYIFALSLGTSEANIQDSGLEKAAADEFRKLFFNKAIELFKESEYGQYIDDALIGNLYKEIFNDETIKIKGRKGRGGGKTFTNVVNGKLTREVELNTSSLSVKPTMPNMSAIAKKAEPATTPSEVNIVALLNGKLSEEIRLRMTYPRLIYRTGRFANSVEVVGQTEDSAGNINISYTYQKNPYQIFEPGIGSMKLATPARDPRTLIEDSIRAIATTIIGSKFNLRRI